MSSQILYTPFLPKKRVVGAQKVGTILTFLTPQNRLKTTFFDDFWAPPENRGFPALGTRPDPRPPQKIVPRQAQHLKTDLDE